MVPLAGLVGVERGLGLRLRRQVRGVRFELQEGMPECDGDGDGGGSGGGGGGDAWRGCDAGGEVDDMVQRRCSKARVRERERVRPERSMSQHGESTSHGKRSEAAFRMGCMRVTAT